LRASTLAVEISLPPCLKLTFVRGDAGEPATLESQRPDQISQ
jgi:hypothetical protein